MELEAGAQADKQIDALVDKTTDMMVLGRNMLVRHKRRTAEWKSLKAHDAREGLYTKAALAMQGAITDFKSTAEKLKRKRMDEPRGPLRSLAESVGQPMTDEQLDSVIQRGQAKQLMQDIMLEGDTARIADMVEDIEKRHGEILQLERSVMELFELFKDLATLVDLQQAPLDEIDRHVTIEDRRRALGRCPRSSEDRPQAADGPARCWTWGRGCHCAQRRHPAKQVLNARLWRTSPSPSSFALRTLT